MKYGIYRKRPEESQFRLWGLTDHFVNRDEVVATANEIAQGGYQVLLQTGQSDEEFPVLLNFDVGPQGDDILGAATGEWSDLL